MKVRIYKDAEQAGKAAATLIGAQLIRKPDSVLGLATGSSPIPIYDELIRMYREGAISFAQATSFNLDEYIGIAEDHPCSYHYFMQEKLFEYVDMRPDAIHVPDGNAENPQAFAAAYDWAIERAGGIDLQVLGIGRNGHIGFNEPGDHFIRGCHVVDLTESTITANQRFFENRDQVPRQAMSLGIEAILKASPPARTRRRPCGTPFTGRSRRRCRRPSCRGIPTCTGCWTRRRRRCCNRQRIPFCRAGGTGRGRRGFLNGKRAQNENRQAAGRAKRVGPRRRKTPPNTQKIQKKVDRSHYLNYNI